MHYQNDKDETLVMLTLAGEQRAYESLVVRYQKSVVASAMMITKNHFMAEDAAQDAFVTAWMKLNTLQDASKYGSWVCRIAKNCAINMLNRYRSFLPLDVVENIAFEDTSQNPSELFELIEYRAEVDKSIKNLPEKVRQIIYLHYFEDMPISDIADKLRISEGTVKWQLHDGRKRIRKELCAMDEKYSDNLVERVMKKVKELKLWQTKNDKTGFEKIYNEVLRDVEELPESTKKQHALADVLMRGWWWLPGQKNDALFARIRKSALEGKNDEVMEFVVTREDSQVYGGAKIEFIRDKQIPILEKAGLTKTLAREWFWLGYYYYRDNQTEKGNEAFDKVQALLTPADRYYALTVYAREVEAKMQAGYREKGQNKFLNNSTAEELRYIDGKLHHWKQELYGEGYLHSLDRYIENIIFNSSRCDGLFFDEKMNVGEARVGTDGTTLTFVSDNEKVETPCGVFDNCQLWITKYYDFEGQCINKTWYRSGVGIVKHERIVDDLSDVRILKKYTVVGGEGVLPLAKGNMWEYADCYDHDYLISELALTVTHADKESVIIASRSFSERFGYDKESWLDTVQEIANEYCSTDENDRNYICNVYPAIERVEKLASTPVQKVHSKMAASVARRILETDPTFNPDHTAVGLWNFFEKNYILKKKDVITTSRYNGRWSFEWKRGLGMGAAETPILFNDILGILQDATNCIWNDEWQIGSSPVVEYTRWDNAITTKISCEDGGTVTTKAGSFENCFKLSLDIGGMNEGWSYRGGKKVYYFADGIGIVRTENEHSSGTRTAVYELTSYEGVGEGYMPISDGLVRKYDALDLTDGFVGSVEYTYVIDENENLVLFTDRKGVRELPPPTTHYSSIQNEMIEDKLWEEGKYDESRLYHDLNNFNLLCHFLGRQSRYWAAPQKAVAWNKYRLKVMEGLNNDNTVPKAWLGLYVSTSFRTACALFGAGNREEGYVWLEKAFSAYPRWAELPDGTEMDVGDPLIYGDIKLVKGKEYIKLPDGKLEPLSYDWIFDCTKNLMYYGLTAAHGWEWFDSVRNDELYKKYVEKAKEFSLAE